MSKYLDGVGLSDVLGRIKSVIPAVDSTPTSGSSNAVSSGGTYTAIQNAISSVYKYKGTKANYASLPSSGNVSGDVWNVEAAYGDYPAGTNWAWTGNGWDALGGEVDLSSYLTKTDASSTYATTTQLTNGSVTKLGTTTIGETAKPIYLNAGTPTALSATVGSYELPVYLHAGTLTKVENIHARYIKGGLKTLGNTTNFLGVDPAFNYNAYAVEQGATVQFYLDGVELVQTSDSFARSLFNGLPSSGGQPFSMSNQSTYGDYSSSKSYVVGELCSYTPSGATKKMWYRNKLACSNIAPTNTTYWEDVSASGSYTGVNPSKFTSLKIVVKNLPSTISYENGLVLFWRTAEQRPKYVTVKKLDTNNNEYLVVENLALVGPSDPIYLGTGANTGTQKGLILEFTGFTQTTYWNFALTQIAFTGMGGSLSGTVLFRSGGTVFGVIAPYSNGLTSIGTSSNRWSTVYGVAGNFSGALTTSSTLSVTGNTTIGGTLTTTGNATAAKFIKSGGTSSQFLKADGSVDSNTYATTNALNGKQDKLTFDTTPTANSTNPVTSGGLNTEFGKVSYVGDNLGTETYTDSGSVVTDLSGYATKAWVEAKGYLTTETDPSVYPWAKAATKPTYTASEVGALPDTTEIPSKLSDLTNDMGFIVGYSFDNVPTLNSSNPVKSGGVYSAISSIRQLPAVSSSDNGKILKVINGVWTAVADTTPTFYSGTSAPSSSLGSDGDIYLQTS